MNVSQREIEIGRINGERQVVVRPPRPASVIEFGGPEDLSILDCVVMLQEALGRRLHVWRVPLTPLHWIGRMARPFNPALDALLEIAEFVEQKGLRADKDFLSAYPIPLTSFRSFLSEQLERT
jgi:hypothetical protein